jgi:transposase
MPRRVWRILRQLGWSCQRPTGRVLERDEEKIWIGSRNVGQS